MPLTITKSVAQLLKEETFDAPTKAESVLTTRLPSIKAYDEYAAVLKMFYGYFHPPGKNLRMYVTDDVLIDTDEKRNSLLILHDLENLSCSTACLSICNDLPEIGNTGRAFGCLYVSEGSALGGAISKMLKANSSINLGEDNLNFFSGYKGDSAKRSAYFFISDKSVREKY